MGAATAQSGRLALLVPSADVGADSALCSIICWSTSPAKAAVASLVERSLSCFYASYASCILVACAKIAFSSTVPSGSF